MRTGHDGRPMASTLPLCRQMQHGSQIWIAVSIPRLATVTGAQDILTILRPKPTASCGLRMEGTFCSSRTFIRSATGRRKLRRCCNAKKVEDEEKNSKVKALIFTHLLYRHWNAYKEGKRTHLFVVSRSTGVPRTDFVGAAAPERAPQSPASKLPAGAHLVLPDSQSSMRAPGHAAGGSGCPPIARDLTPGDYDAPVFSLGGQDDYAFSPDGQEICYASNHDPVPAISTNNDLFTVPVNFPADATSKEILAATKDITADNKAADNTPLYSPDGKYIAYRAQLVRDTRATAGDSCCTTGRRTRRKP